MTPRSQHRPGSRHPAPPVVFQVVGPVERSDVDRWCSVARAALADVEHGRAVICDVADLGPPDAAALDLLARLQLTAKRLGHEVRLRDASPALRDLLQRAGLCEVVPSEPSPVRRRRQPEQREEPGGVEERREPGDPSL